MKIMAKISIWGFGLNSIALFIASLTSNYTAALISVVSMFILYKYLVDNFIEKETSQEEENV